VAALLILVAAACTDQPLPTGTSSPAIPHAFPRTPNATDNGSVDRRVSAVQISVGYLPHACAVESDSQVICWGSVGNPPFARFAGPYFSVAAGGADDCALRLDGTIHCFWGFMTPPAGRFSRITLGVDHGCAVRNPEGTIVCWGNNDYGKATPPEGTFSYVDAGNDNTCGIHTDRTHECWGNPASSNVDLDLDEPVSDWPGLYDKVSAGGSHTCAITVSSDVLCGGSNKYSQSSGPSSFSNAIDISAGGFHTCGIATTFFMFCWGLDIADETEPPSGQYTSVAAGTYFTCAITKAGNAKCFGSDNYGIQSIPYEIGETLNTTTDLDIDPRPSTFGTNVTMTATVTVPARITEDGDLAEKPSTGRVMFIDGGTCASPTTVLAEGVAIAKGTASFLTKALGVGTHAIGACYLGGDGLNASGDGAILEIGAAATTTTITLTPASQQYSDKVTIEASITPASVNGTATAGVVQFTIDGALVGAGPVVVTGGKATLPNVQMTKLPGSHSVGAQFTPDDQTLFQSSTATAASLTVTKEDASIVYSADNTTAIKVTTSGGNLAANALALQLGVKETEPDVAGTGTTGLGSNIPAVNVAVSLLPIGPGSVYALTCTATGVTGTGYATTHNFSCKNPASLPVNVYAVQATLTSDYYQATQYEDVVTVYDPVAGFVTGGGTFRIDGDLVRFGINLKYKTNTKGSSTTTQGSIFAVRHHANGRKSRFESNSLNSAVALGEDLTVPMGWAVLSGKSTYTTWDAATSAEVTLGGQAFTVYVEDRGEPGAGVDRVWMGGPGVLTLAGTLTTARTSAVTLTGGNVAVPHKAP
jgi:alpha-tubulin suppressor-like RCC1 family protein